MCWLFRFGTATYSIQICFLLLLQVAKKAKSHSMCLLLLCPTRNPEALRCATHECCNITNTIHYPVIVIIRVMNWPEMLRNQTPMVMMKLRDFCPWRQCACAVRQESPPETCHGQCHACCSMGGCHSDAPFKLASEPPMPVIHWPPTDGDRLGVPAGCGYPGSPGPGRFVGPGLCNSTTRLGWWAPF